MKFIYRGPFSKGLDTQEAMGVTFTGREPSEVRELPSINWMLGHPEYELQAEEVAEEVIAADPEEEVEQPIDDVKKARKVKK
jgi:hypothetical protein